MAGDNPNGVPPNDSHDHPLHLLPPDSKGSIGQRALGTVAPWRWQGLGVAQQGCVQPPP